MRPLLFSLLLLLTAGPLAAQEPEPAPAADELTQLLQREPINLANWPKWSPRLRAWSGAHLTATMPAFEEAFQFTRAHRFTFRFHPKYRNLNGDAVALMVLGGSFLHDPAAAEHPVDQGKAAEASLKASLKLDGKLARTHYWLGQAVRLRELSPKDLGGPDQPRPGRLREARGQFVLARKLDASLPPLTPREEGELALGIGEFFDAEKHLRQALKETPGDTSVARQLARALTSGQRQRGRWAAPVRLLREQFPHDGPIATRYGLALARDGQLQAGLKEFDRARELGTDPASVIPASEINAIQDAARKGEEERRKREEEKRKRAEEKQKQAEQQRQKQAQQARAQQQKPQKQASGGEFWTLLFWFFVVYGVVIGLMFLAGLLLAKWTRGPGALDLLGAALERLVARGQVLRTTHESKLTRLYCIGLALALILFYAAIPIVIWGMLIIFLIVLVVGFSFRRDHSSARLHNDLLKASGGGMWAVIKSLFASFGRGGRGILKTADDCPRLYEVLQEVARRVDTDPVDEVYLSPDSMIGVRQEGRGPFGIFGARRRILTLGLCSMHYLTVNELKSILAHEYAHFSHKDTFYSRFIYQVTLSMSEAMRGMARAGGWLTYLNPFYWFFFLYSKAYALLSAGYSRSREFLADRMACSLYGSDVFGRALETVCVDGMMFEREVYDNIVKLLRQKKVFANVYLAYRRYRERETTRTEREKICKRLRAEKESLFDSHPTFAERLAAVAALPRAEKTDTESAMTLFEEPEEIEKELTAFLTAVVDYCRSGRR